jgi:HAMP domain-containing protein
MPFLKIKSLQAKLLIAILATGLLSGILTLTLIYLHGTNTLQQSIGNTFKELAETISEDLGSSISHHIEESQLMAATTGVVATVEESNLLYEGEPEDAVRKRIQEIEDRWTKAAGMNAYLFEILNNKATLYLKEFLANSKDHDIYNYILITNERGAVVAATQKPVHYAYNQEDWWKKAFNDGIGNLHVGNIVMDRDLGAYTFNIATPIMKSGRAIGVILMSHNAERFFKPVTSAKVGKTDHVMLANSKGEILFCPIFPVKSHRLDASLTREIFKDTAGWTSTRHDVHYPGRETLNGYAPVKITSALGKENFGGEQWYIFTSQDPSETYGPIYGLLKWIAISGLLGAGIIAILAYLAAGRIIRPIRLLQTGAERIGTGDMDYRIEVHTGDEIEDLAVKFNAMAGRLKLFYIKLEEMVKERTRELEQSNEETSILYSMVSALNRSINITDTFDESMKTMLELIKADAATIWMLDPRRGQFTVTASRGLRNDPAQNERLSELFETIGDQIIRNGNLWTSENLSTESRLEEPRISDEDYLAVTGIPLKSKDKVIAILFLLFKNIRALTTREENVLKSVGSQIGIAIENAQLFSKLLKHDEPKPPETP